MVGGRGSFPSHLLSRDGSLRVSRIAADFRGVFSPATNAPERAKVARVCDSPRQSTMHGCEVRAHRDEVGRPETLHARNMLSRRALSKSEAVRIAMERQPALHASTLRRNVARGTDGLPSGCRKTVALYANVRR